MQCCVQVRENGVSADNNSYRQHRREGLAAKINILGRMGIMGTSPSPLTHAVQQDAERTTANRPHALFFSLKYAVEPPERVSIPQVYFDSLA